MFELQEKIEAVREYLDQLLAIKKSHIDDEVVNISQTLDRLITKYYSMRYELE